MRLRDEALPCDRGHGRAVDDTICRRKNWQRKGDERRKPPERAEPSGGRAGCATRRCRVAIGRLLRTRSRGAEEGGEHREKTPGRKGEGGGRGWAPPPVALAAIGQLPLSFFPCMCERAWSNVSRRFEAPACNVLPYFPQEGMKPPSVRGAGLPPRCPNPNLPSRSCPQCGRAIPPGCRTGGCPHCLLAAGLASEPAAPFRGAGTAHARGARAGVSPTRNPRAPRPRRHGRRLQGPADARSTASSR